MNCHDPVSPQHVSFLHQTLHNLSILRLLQFINDVSSAPLAESRLRNARRRGAIQSQSEVRGSQQLTRLHQQWGQLIASVLAD